MDDHAEEESFSRPGAHAASTMFYRWEKNKKSHADIQGGGGIGLGILLD